MKIIVSTGSWAKRYLENDPYEFVLPEGSTVAAALAMLPLPSAEVGMTAINGQAVRQSFLLSEGDLLKIYPVIIGG